MQQPVANITLQRGEENIVKVYYQSRSLIIQVSGKTTEKVYNGAEQTLTADELYTIVDTLPEGFVLAYTGTIPSWTDVGTHTVTLYEQNFAVTCPGYKQEKVTIEVTDSTATLVITAKPVELHLKGTQQTVVYDGKAHTAPASYEKVGEWPAGLNVTLPADFVSGASGTNVGSYPMGLTKDTFTVTGNEKGNYTPTVVVDEDGGLTITKPPRVDITTELSIGSWVYGDTPAAPKAEAYLTADPGSTYGEPTFTYAAVEDGPVTVEEYATPPQDAGHYVVIARWTETDNLPPCQASEEFYIYPRPITLTSGTAQKVYDGTALTAENVTPTYTGEAGKEALVGDDALEYEVTASQTDAGETENVFTWAINGGKDPNYAVTVE